MNLKSEQRRLYELLCTEARCFVRICDDDCALWVSDFPRRGKMGRELADRLRAEGFVVWTDQAARMAYVDWTPERWREALQCLPQICPPFPVREELHVAYALCRLWLMHPTPLAQEHLPALRRVLKLDSSAKVQSSIRQLYEQAAGQLREGKNVAHAAGRVLAAWLKEQTNGRETQR